MWSPASRGQSRTSSRSSPGVASRACTAQRSWTRLSTSSFDPANTRSRRLRFVRTSRPRCRRCSRMATGTQPGCSQAFQIHFHHKEWAGFKRGDDDRIGLRRGDHEAEEADQGCSPGRCGRGRRGPQRVSQVTPSRAMHGRALRLRRPAREGQNSRFSSFVTWFESVQGTLPERSGDATSLFPCALPYPEALRVEAVDTEAEAPLNLGEDAPERFRLLVKLRGARLPQQWQ